MQGLPGRLVAFGSGGNAVTSCCSNQVVRNSLCSMEQLVSSFICVTLCGWGQRALMSAGVSVIWEPYFIAAKGLDSLFQL